MSSQPGPDLAPGRLGPPGLAEPPSPGLAERRLRDVLGRFASGVTVVTGLADGVPVGLTCQAFSSVSLDPPLVLFVPSATSRSWPVIQRIGRFAVNVLAEDQRVVAEQLAGRGADKFAGLDWAPRTATGSPRLAGSLSWLDCTVQSVHPGGDHDVVLGRVVDLGLGTGRRPLLFSAGAYRRLDEPDVG